MKRSILCGILTFAAGLVAVGTTPSAGGFMLGVLTISVGSVWQPALQAFVANMGHSDERGALLGALGSVSELTRALGTLLYSSILAYVSSPASRLPLPGMHFLVAAVLVVAGGLISGVALNLPAAASFL